MGIIKKIKEKFSKNKIQVMSATDLSKVCLGYEEEVELLSHAVSTSKPEDKAYFASRTEKYIKNYEQLEKEIELSREKANEDVEDFLETGDDILAHHSQEYYDDLLAEWRADVVLINMAESRLKASYTALCELRDFFNEKSPEYDAELVTKIASQKISPDELKRQAKRYAADEVAAIEPNNPFKLDSGLLAKIAKAASIVTMGVGLAETDVVKTATGAALYHLSDNAEKQAAEREPE